MHIFDILAVLIRYLCKLFADIKGIVEFVCALEIWLGSA